MDTVYNNRAFWRALHGLTHNVCLAAICALLLNDHFLRVRYGSWITGKLGDFAWLVFAPFICALAFAWIVRGARQETVVAVASFGFIGIWFALAKTIPLINSWTVDGLAWLLGYRGALRIDPTDLLTLPGLWIGWRVWRKADNKPATLKARAWVFVAAGMMATVATSAAAQSPYGIGKLCANESEILALEFPLASARGYVSRDGGLTWSLSGNVDAAILERCEGLRQPIKAAASFLRSGRLNDKVRHYRIVNFNPRVTANGDYVLPRDDASPRTEGPSAIESSVDGGRIWTTEFDLSDVDTEVRRILYSGPNRGLQIYGPLDALVSEEGNVVVAMGTDGALVRKKEGAWIWSSVGGFRHSAYDTKDRLSLLLSKNPKVLFVPGQFPMVLVFASISMMTIGSAFSPASRWRRGVAILMWGLFAVWWTPTYGGGLAEMALLLLLPTGAFAAVVTGIRIYRIEPLTLVVLLGLSVFATGIFLLPFVLWVFDTVPNYDLAQAYASGLGAAAVATSWVYMRRRRKLEQQ